MAISADSLVIRAREHLTERDEEERFSPERLRALVPSALALWIERTGSDARKRRQFLAQTGQIPITNLRAECAVALEAKGIAAQFVNADAVTVTDDADEAHELSVAFVNSRTRLKFGGVQDDLFLTAFFDGKNIFFGENADLPETGATLQISAVCVPTDLADVPQSVEGELSTILAEIARKFNTDGESKGALLNMQKAQRKL